MKGKKTAIEDVRVKGYTFFEVEKALIEENSIQKVMAKLPGIASSDIYNFKSRFKKELNQRKAEREQGLLMDGLSAEKPEEDEMEKQIALLKQTIESNESVIEGQQLTIQRMADKANNADEELKKENRRLLRALDAKDAVIERWKEKAEELKTQKPADADDSALKIAQETIDNQAEQIKQLNEQAVKDVEEIKELTDRNIDLEYKTMKMNEMQKKFHEKKIAEKQLQIDGQLRALEAAANDVESMRKEITALRKDADETEQRTAEMVVNYEAHIKNLQEEIEELSSRPAEEAEVVQNDNLTNDSQYVMRGEEESRSLYITDNSLTAKILQTEVDNVNSPKHYASDEIEVIDFIDQVVKRYEAPQAFYIANIIKYVARAPMKNGVEDLKKAQWYLNRLINKRSGQGA